MDSTIVFASPTRRPSALLPCSPPPTPVTPFTSMSFVSPTSFLSPQGSLVSPLMSPEYMKRRTYDSVFTSPDYLKQNQSDIIREFTESPLTSPDYVKQGHADRRGSLDESPLTSPDYNKQSQRDRVGGLNESPLTSPDYLKRGRPRANMISTLITRGTSVDSDIRCRICSRIFPREKSLQAHMRTHTGKHG